jgi:hypothetical protein
MASHQHFERKETLHLSKVLRNKKTIAKKMNKITL